jgi:hypothetical protein
LTECAGESFKAVERRLQELLTELRDSLPPLQRAQLDSAQRAWAAYARVECRLEAVGYEGGSMHSMQVTLCRGAGAAARIAELAPLLCDLGASPDEDCPRAARYTQPDKPRYSTSQGYVPPQGFVPDSATAVRIAVAVWIPIYGERQVMSEQPFVATLKGDLWTVTGSLPRRARGGTAVARIAKQDGRVLHVAHGK